MCLAVGVYSLPKAMGGDVALSGHHPYFYPAGRRELSDTSSYLVMLLQLRKRRCNKGRRSTSVYKEKEGEGRQRDGGMWRWEGAQEEGTASSLSSRLCIPLHSLSHLAALSSSMQHPHPPCACTHTYTHTYSMLPCLHMERRGNRERERKRARIDRLWGGKGGGEGRVENVLR